MAFNTLPEIVNFLKYTFLSEATVAELEIPESNECAIAIDIQCDRFFEKMA